jgi:hypothetical protein
MPSGKLYTVEEDAIITESYPVMSTRKLWQDFLPHRSLKGINLRAFRLGVKKEPEARDFKEEVTTMIGHLPEAERHYFAGIFDGEGCVHMRIDKKGICRFYVSIATTSPGLLAWIKENVPGKSYDIPRKKPNKKPAWMWVIPGNRRVICFCREIAPYLIVKRRQAELVGGGYIRLDAEARRKMHDTLRAMKRTD